MMMMQHWIILKLLCHLFLGGCTLRWLHLRRYYFVLLNLLTAVQFQSMHFQVLYKYFLLWVRVRMFANDADAAVRSRKKNAVVAVVMKALERSIEDRFDRGARKPLVEVERAKHFVRRRPREDRVERTLLGWGELGWTMVGEGLARFGPPRLALPGSGVDEETGLDKPADHRASTLRPAGELGRRGRRGGSGEDTRLRRRRTTGGGRT